MKVSNFMTFIILLLISFVLLFHLFRLFFRNLFRFNFGRKVNIL